MRTKPVKTRAELCHMLAKGLAKSRKALEDTTEDHLLGMWRFRMNGKVVSEGPRYAMIADGAMTHLAHHRGQLTVYLRLLEKKVPAHLRPLRRRALLDAKGKLRSCTGNSGCK